jgi:hypothetical protein
MSLTVRSDISHAVHQLMKSCIDGLSALILSRTIIKFMSFMCTNNTTEFNKSNYLSSSTLIQILTVFTQRERYPVSTTQKVLTPD